VYWGETGKAHTGTISGRVPWGRLCIYGFFVAECEGAGREKTGRDLAREGIDRKAIVSPETMASLSLGPGRTG